VVIGLTLGDYFLWNWSLNSGHAALALISGLTFPPLALMLLWLLAVGAAKLLARTARRPAARRRLAAPRDRPARPVLPAAARTAAASAADGTTRSPPTGGSARKLAA
ncbi:MAG: hypothetical protein ACYDC2_04830, partial [Solirubrobacteraceae bacterium]